MVPKKDMSKIVLKLYNSSDSKTYLRVFASNDLIGGGLYDDVEVYSGFKIIGIYERGNFVIGHSGNIFSIYNFSTGVIAWSHTPYIDGGPIIKAVYNPATDVIAYSDTIYGLVVLKSKYAPETSETEAETPESTNSSEPEQSNNQLTNLKGENQLKTIFENQVSKTVMSVGRIAAVAASFIGGSSGCFSSGYSFIKLFQVIEVLGKLMYIPVHFSGELNDILEGVNDLADPIEIPPELLMKGSLIKSHTSFRGKILENEEYGYILQSMPVSVLIFILFEIAITILQIQSAKKSNQLQPKVYELETVFEEPPKLKWYSREKLLVSLMNSRLSFIESILGDIFFYTSINLSNYSKSTSKLNLINLINFIASSALVLRSMQLYSQVYFKVKSEKFESLSEVEKDLAFDGLDENIYEPALKKQARVNFYFKLQMCFIPIVLVIG